MPSHAAPALAEQLFAAGAAAGCNEGRGLAWAGYRALLSSLRLEKRFVHFGHDVSCAAPPRRRAAAPPRRHPDARPCASPPLPSTTTDLQTLRSRRGLAS